MEKQEYAKILAKKYGLRVFPLAPGSKEPRHDMTKFWEKASADERVIEELWPEGSKDNIGICATINVHGGRLLVIDVDNKKGKNGEQELQRLDNDGFHLPRTFVQKSPNGFHYFFCSKGDPRNTVERIAKGIDTRGLHGYLVGYGSVVEGKMYEIENDSLLAWAPDWPEEMAKAKTPTGGHQELPLTKEVQDIARSCAIRYLQGKGAAIEGQGGDNKTYEVACGLKDLGIGTELGAKLMMEYWHEGCGWSHEDLVKKMQRAYRYGKEMPGLKLRSEMQRRAREDEKKTETEYFEKLNKRYAISRVGDSKVWILDRREKATGFLSRADFLLLTESSNYVVRYMDGEKEKTVIRNAGKEWLKWRGRKEFKGVEFMPGVEGEDVNGFYNGWRGWGVKRRLEDLATPEQVEGADMFFAHVKNVICEGDDSQYKWVMSYISDMYQNPAKRPDTVLVIKGEMGSGKGTFVDVLGKIIGERHYSQVQDIKDMTGQYNGVLYEKLLINLDEATFHGDKAERDRLKAITGAKQLSLNIKFGPQLNNVKNHCRFIITSNSRRPVDTETGNRRYTILNCGDTRVNDIKYYAKMDQLIFEKKGIEVIFERLMNHRVDSNMIRTCLKNVEMVRQKIESFDLAEKFVFESVCQGKILGGGGGYQFVAKLKEYLPWPTRIPTIDLHKIYLGFCAEARSKYEEPTTLREFTLKFKKLTGAVPCKMYSSGIRCRGLEVPPLQQVKERLEEVFGTIPWTEYVTEGELCDF